MGLQVFFRNARCAHEGPLEARFQIGVAIRRDGKTGDGAFFDVNAMAAIDASEHPTILL